MKRYNVHLDPEWITELDKIRREIIDSVGKCHRLYDLTRADLIRVAMRGYYQLGPAFVHYYGKDLDKIIKKVVKERNQGR